MYDQFITCRSHRAAGQRGCVGTNRRGYQNTAVGDVKNVGTVNRGSRSSGEIVAQGADARRLGVSGARVARRVRYVGERPRVRSVLGRVRHRDNAEVGPRPRGKAGSCGVGEGRPVAEAGEGRGVRGRCDIASGWLYKVDCSLRTAGDDLQGGGQVGAAGCRESQLAVGIRRQGRAGVCLGGGGGIRLVDIQNRSTQSERAGGAGKTTTKLAASSPGVRGVERAATDVDGACEGVHRSRRSCQGAGADLGQRASRRAAVLNDTGDRYVACATDSEDTSGCSILKGQGVRSGGTDGKGSTVVDERVVTAGVAGIAVKDKRARPLNHTTTSPDGDTLGEGVGAAVGRLEVTTDKGKRVGIGTDRGRSTRVGSGGCVHLEDTTGKVGVTCVCVGGAADAKKAGCRVKTSVDRHIGRQRACCRASVLDHAIQNGRARTVHVEGAGIGGVLKIDGAVQGQAVAWSGDEVIDATVTARVAYIAVKNNAVGATDLEVDVGKREGIARRKRPCATDGLDRHAVAVDVDGTSAERVIMPEHQYASGDGRASSVSIVAGQSPYAVVRLQQCCCLRSYRIIGNHSADLIAVRIGAAQVKGARCCLREGQVGDDQRPTAIVGNARGACGTTDFNAACDGFTGTHILQVGGVGGGTDHETINGISRASHRTQSATGSGVADNHNAVFDDDTARCRRPSAATRECVAARKHESTAAFFSQRTDACGSGAGQDA